MNKWREWEVSMNAGCELEKIKPVESEKYPGYYFHPEIEGIVVSPLGDVLNERTGKLIKPVFNKKNNRYVISKWDRKNKRMITTPVHRLLARIFIGRPLKHVNKPYSELHVNHINSNSLDNNLSNLEWVTSQENIEHQVLSYIRVETSPLLILDEHGNIERIPGAMTYCRRFNLSRAALYKRLHTKGYSYIKRTLTLRENSFNTFPLEDLKYFLDCLILCDGNPHLKSRITVFHDVFTNKRYIFNYVEEGLVALNILGKLINHSVNGISISKNKRFVTYRLRDYLNLRIEIHALVRQLAERTDLKSVGL